MSAATILVVEDDPANRELIVELLEAYGYQVCEAKDGYAAIEMAKAERPRLILMDLGLPGLDGIETTRCLKADHPPVNSDRCRDGPQPITGASGQIRRVRRLPHQTDQPLDAA